MTCQVSTRCNVIVVVFMNCFYIVSVLNKPHIHHHVTET
jgi:hypothetical protein